MSDALIEKHYTSVLDIARKYAYRYGVDEDLASNLAIERLIKCANNGDRNEETGAPFIGYVEKSVRLDIIHAKTHRVINAGASVEYAACDDTDGLIASLYHMTYLMDFKHRQIHEARSSNNTQQSIADKYGIGKKRVQIVQKRIRKSFMDILQLVNQ